MKGLLWPWRRGRATRLSITVTSPRGRRHVIVNADMDVTGARTQVDVITCLARQLRDIADGIDDLYQGDPHEC